MKLRKANNRIFVYSDYDILIGTINEDKTHFERIHADNFEMLIFCSIAKKYDFYLQQIDYVEVVERAKNMGLSQKKIAEIMDKPESHLSVALRYGDRYFTETEIQKLKDYVRVQ